jgi:hypothetical protein
MVVLIVVGVVVVVGAAVCADVANEHVPNTKDIPPSK